MVKNPLMRFAEIEATGGKKLHSNHALKVEHGIQKSREYQRRYRVRKLQHTIELEEKLKQLQIEVAVAYPQIDRIRHQQLLIKLQNSELKEKISTLRGELMIKEAETHRLNQKMELLKQLRMKQQQQQQQHQPLSITEDKMKETLDPNVDYAHFFGFGHPSRPSKVGGLQAQIIDMNSPLNRMDGLYHFQQIP